MIFKKIFRLTKNLKLVGSVLLLFISFQGCAESSSFEKTAFLWLEYGQKVNETNGSVTQTVYIKSSTDLLPIADIKDLTAFYCDGRQKGEKQYYIIPVEQKDGLYFLRLNTASRFDYQVYVTGNHQGEHFTAQISIPLYADGLDKTIKKERVLLENPEIVFSIDSSIDPRSITSIDWMTTSWPRTGQTLQFVSKPINSSGYPVKEMNIIDLSNKRIEKLIPDDTGMFSFTPPHDKRLDGGGSSAYKEIIVYTEQVSGNEVYKTSMNLLLHRSLSAHINQTQGIFLFFSAMAVVIAIVLFRRRSFMYQYGR